MKCYIYCTKSKFTLYKQFSGYDNEGKMQNIIYHLTKALGGFPLNGKIVAECDFEVEEIKPCISPIDKKPYAYFTRELERWELVEHGCLSFEQLDDYLKGKNGYALHIKNLHIFDTPKELEDFTTRTPVDYDSIICDSCTNFNSDCKKCRYSYDYQQVIKAPKNMMKVCEWDIEDKVLISIRPEWLCKILNGEKTIEVRKKVLKEMLENE